MTRTLPSGFTVETTPLPGVLVLTAPAEPRADGSFLVWADTLLTEAGVSDAPDFVQHNQSVSEREGTLRGLHYQAPPKGQGKLVRCGAGRLFDVMVDGRRGSPTYGQWFGVELTPANRRQVWIPEGFLHGFVTREPGTEILYKCTNPYDAALDGGVRWDSCGIDWDLTGAPVLSAKDSTAPAIADWTSPFRYD